MHTKRQLLGPLRVCTQDGGIVGHVGLVPIRVCFLLVFCVPEVSHPVWKLPEGRVESLAFHFCLWAWQGHLSSLATSFHTGLHSPLLPAPPSHVASWEELTEVAVTDTPGSLLGILARGRLLCPYQWGVGGRGHQGAHGEVKDLRTLLSSLLLASTAIVVPGHPGLKALRGIFRKKCQPQNSSLCFSLLFSAVERVPGVWSSALALGLHLSSGLKCVCGAGSGVDWPYCFLPPRVGRLAVRLRAGSSGFGDIEV